jgi:sterol 14-demethylase
VLQILMDAVYKDGTTMTDDNIAGLLIGVLFAGQHTSSITGTWTLLFLLKNPGLHGQSDAGAARACSRPTASTAAS